MRKSTTLKVSASFGDDRMKRQRVKPMGRSDVAPPRTGREIDCRITWQVAAHGRQVTNIAFSYALVKSSGDLATGIQRYAKSP